MFYDGKEDLILRVRELRSFRVKIEAFFKHLHTKVQIETSKDQIFSFSVSNIHVCTDKWILYCTMQIYSVYKQNKFELGFNCIWGLIIEPLCLI